MASSESTTVDQYLSELPEDRREAIETVRSAILEHLPDGFVETMNWGMICYEVPLETFPDTYNKKPLMYAALASQKRHMAVYLTAIYTDDELEGWFRSEYEATGKKMDIGKSCVRFTKLDNLPVDLVGQAIAKTSLEGFLDIYRASRGE